MDSSEHNYVEVKQDQGSGYAGYWLAAAIIILAAVCVFAYSDSHRQQRRISELNAHESDMHATIDQLQSELNDVNAKMSDMQASQTAAIENAVAAAKAGTRTATRTAASDPRWNKVQTQLQAQQQQLANEQNSLDQTKSDLEGSISSTHDELNGSIAKTHDELVALEQRGQRNYDEFDLAKGKNNRFFRVGPIAIALRKADTKHKHYDLAMMVNDNQIQKKDVNLYEPIWLRGSDDPQPVEIVVNKIDKDHIHGYVSSPKFTQAQLAPAQTSGAVANAQN